MGGLNSSGSSKALRRIHFPHGFAGEVMMHVLETWQSFSLNRPVRLENDITALFCYALIDAYEVAGRNWVIIPEHPINDPISGVQLARNDLRFLPPKHFGQKIFFELECKRLRVRTESGFKHLADEYVEDGLQRFVDGKYSSGLPCGGMLGYVMDNCVNESFESVQREIEKRQTVLKMKKKKSVCVPSSTLPSHRHSLDTFHFRSDGELTIHHLFVGIANDPAGVPLQLETSHFAERKICDVDQPRNLAKSVTVE